MTWCRRETQRSIEIAAPASTVWSTWIDVERLPEWAPATRATMLDAGPLRLGSRVRLELPKLPTAVWRVDTFEPDRTFAWSARTAGVKTVATHDIVPAADGRVTAVLTIDGTGLLAPLIGLLFRSLTRRYLDTEATGLKARCESADEGGE